MGIVENVLRFFYGDRPLAHRAVPEPHALDVTCAKYQCRYERVVFPTGEVQMRLIRDDATLTAVAPSTAAAVAALVKKADACWGSLV